MALEKLKPQTGQSSVKRMFQRTLMVLFAMTTSMMISTASFASCGSDDGGNELGLSGTDGTCG